MDWMQMMQQTKKKKGSNISPPILPAPLLKRVVRFHSDCKSEEEQNTRKLVSTCDVCGYKTFMKNDTSYSDRPGVTFGAKRHMFLCCRPNCPRYICENCILNPVLCSMCEYSGDDYR